MPIHTTVTSERAWSPDVTTVPPDEAIPDALVNIITTVAAAVEGDAVAVRVPVVLDDEANIVPEGDQIPEADPDLSETVVTTAKVAKLLRLSREQFVQPNAAALLSSAAGRSIIAKADDVLLNTLAPVAPALTPPAGILAQGITNGGTIADNLDGLVDALAAIQAAGGNPSHIVLSPTAWASLRKFKTGAGSELTILGTGAADAQPVLLGVPVLVNKAVPANSGLVVDKADIVSAVGSVLVSQSEHAYFTSDSMALRVTFRFGARVIHPDRHASFTVTAPEEPTP